MEAMEATLKPSASEALLGRKAGRGGGKKETKINRLLVTGRVAGRGPEE